MVLKKQHTKNYAAEKQTVLPVMEQFYSLQGEGFHAGKAAYFIRLAGCDVGCFWCDVKESWNAEEHPDLEVDAVVDQANGSENDMVVVSGGEPLMYNLTYLTQTLHDKNLKTHIETSGAYPLTGDWDWVCLSPKKFKKPVDDIYPHVHELKMIIFNKSDFDFAEEYAAKVPSDCKLFLQVEWSKSNEMLPLIVEYVKSNPKWRISLQTHKFLEIE